LFYILDDVFKRNCVCDSRVLAETRHAGWKQSILWLKNVNKI